MNARSLLVNLLIVSLMHQTSHSFTLSDPAFAAEEVNQLLSLLLLLHQRRKRVLFVLQQSYYYSHSSEAPASK